MIIVCIPGDYRYCIPTRCALTPWMPRDLFDWNFLLCNSLITSVGLIDCSSVLNERVWARGGGGGREGGQFKKKKANTGN